MSLSLSTAAPFPADERRISRKLTINIEQSLINVRPVIKGAIKEAAHTLADAYAGNAMFDCGLDHRKHDEFLYTLFKTMINNATLQSRDYAIQVEGCTGVLVWTNQPQGYHWPQVFGTAKLASFIGWAAALKATIQNQPSSDKIRRKIMKQYPYYITIGYMGVLPHEQRKGFGSALLQHLTDKADTAQHPICVQVNDDKAIKFFEKHGFTIAANLKNQSVFMLREPVVASTNSEPKPLRIRPGRRISDY
ncbi:hypothetical protein BDB00DRAFT_840819 [Zychaea mexicana]|uniref:uncharacterized protein n=1 Tax=Zychaea mexicana TaxID=64656 RepID=UPI0022FDE686|nr:uncharacterized protein BDB00DRAFT_840819 [Zychaea mexicana]KAI9489815.1 hypothetical protein BDB00DRAFT_840819 [Zychaea mexicana]